MRNIVTAVIALLCAVAMPRIAAAGECPASQTTRYTKEQVTELCEPTLYVDRLCCCFDNEVSVASSSDVIEEEDVCCETYSFGAYTYTIAMVRTATPIEREDVWNKLDENGEPVSTPLPVAAVYKFCVMPDGTSTVCEIIVEENLFYHDFECEACEE